MAVQDLLSQDEIDALLHGVDDGGQGQTQHGAHGEDQQRDGKEHTDDEPLPVGVDHFGFRFHTGVGLQAESQFGDGRLDLIGLDERRIIGQIEFSTGVVDHGGVNPGFFAQDPFDGLGTGHTVHAFHRKLLFPDVAGLGDLLADLIPGQ